MPVRADLVEDHPDDPDTGVEGNESLDDGADTTTCGGGVDHEHDRCLQQLRDVRGRREPLGAESAVVQAHHAFDHRDVGTGRTVREERCDPFLTGQHRVQVAPRPPGRHGMETGVDVVRPDLEPGHHVPGPPQRRHQPDGNRRLPGAGRRRRDDHAGNHHEPT